MKQETIEEAAEQYIAEDNNNRHYNDFIEGAKYMAERMYSEEEVLELIKKTVYKKQNAWKVGELDDWFEQFKKK
jgi:hypothetical protein